MVSISSINDKGKRLQSKIENIKYESFIDTVFSQKSIEILFTSEIVTIYTYKRYENDYVVLNIDIDDPSSVHKAIEREEVQRKP